MRLSVKDWGKVRLNLQLRKRAEGLFSCITCRRILILNLEILLLTAINLSHEFSNFLLVLLPESLDLFIRMNRNELVLDQIFARSDQICICLVVGGKSEFEACFSEVIH